MNYDQEREFWEKFENQKEEESFGKKMLQGTKSAIDGPRYKAPIKAISLGMDARKSINDFDDTPFFFLFPFAIMIDFIDLIPFAGGVVTWFLKPFLFVALWGKGRWKVKVFRIILLLTDYAPIVNKLPWSTISVLYVYNSFKKDKREAQLKISKAREVAMA